MSLVVQTACLDQTHGKFPDVRQGDQFCTRPEGASQKSENSGVRQCFGRCTGRLVTKKEGNYKFFLASDDGVLDAEWQEGDVGVSWAAEA